MKRNLRHGSWLAALVVLVLCLTWATTARAEAAQSAGMAFAPGVSFAKTHEPISGGGGGTPETFRQAILAAPEVTQAGAHADAGSGFKLVDAENGTPSEQMLRDVVVDAPAGFMGNPLAVPECPMRDFMTGTRPSCPRESQVGTSITWVGGATTDSANVYRVPRPPNAPARFGFRTLGGDNFFLIPTVRSDGDYGLRVGATNINFKVVAATVDLWAQPHNAVHGSASSVPASGATPFLTNPTFCGSGPLSTHISARWWKAPDEWVRDFAVSPEPTGCEKLEFGTVRAPVSLDFGVDSSRGGVPVGLSAELQLPYNHDPNGLARPALRDTVVELPEGLIINPSSGDGLESCSQAEVRWQREGAADCPEASKLASARVVTPVLDEPLDGAVYLAEPYENPLGEFMAMYVVVAGQGVDAKVVGEVERDPSTGRLTAVFRDNPQLPFTDLDLRFKSGPRAALVSPSACGSHESVSTLKPWSFPHSGPEAVATSRFGINQGPDGGACLSGEREFSPKLQAGTADAKAGVSSSFALRISRDDAEEELRTVASVTMPEGLVGKVADVELCSDADAAAGTCPVASKIGHVQVAAGAGNQPLWVPQPGKAATGVYLTGPYKDAPYGLSIVVPAQAGPFDLGKVVVRNALRVDERTAQISSSVDEARLIKPDGSVAEFGADLPRILEGIVLNQREIRVIVDRPGFMINPTDCSRQNVTTKLTGYEGSVADTHSRFGVIGCANLGFKPKFRAKILDKGRKSTRRSWHPRTRFTVVPRPGDANIGGARVALPSSTILDQGNIGTTCTRAQMAARDCPAKSIVGYAKAWSPLLRRTVEGPVYLAANGGVRPLPDIAAVLDGEVRVMLVGEVTTLRTGGKARLQNTFRVVPDAPVTRFELTMQGGKNTGLLVNSTDLCRTSERGVSVFTGQNGRQSRSALRLTPSFKGCGKVRRQAARKAAKRKAARKAAARRIARNLER